MSAACSDSTLWNQEQTIKESSLELSLLFFKLHSFSSVLLALSPLSLSVSSPLPHSLLEEVRFSLSLLSIAADEPQVP